MKNPESSAQGAGNSGRLLGTTIASPDLCPYASECRREWTYLSGTETAECAFCYQVLDRSTMARIFAGTM